MENETLTTAATFDSESYTSSTAATTITVELSGLTLADVLLLYSAKSGSHVLSLMSPDSAGLMVITDGVLTHLQFNEKRGAKALLAILNCANTVVTAVDCPPPSIETICIDHQTLRKLVEARSAAERATMLPSDIVDYNEPLHRAQANTVINLSEPLELEKGDEGEAPGDPVKQWLQSPSIEATLDRISDPHSVMRVPKQEQPLEPTKILDAAVRRRLRKLIGSGITHFRNHDFDEAERCWSEALMLDPENVQAKKNLQILTRVRSS